MIDTHAHLSKRFCDVPKVEGVKVILAASNLTDSKENIELVINNKGQFWPSVGIHPQCTDPENLESIEQQLNMLDSMVNKYSDMVIAIGETGLDYSPPPPGEKERSKSEQEILFRKQIEIAKKYRLPLIIHARKSMDEVLGILSEYKKTKGVLHCYTGGKKRIQKVISLGSDWYLGVDGNLTYEVGLSEVVAEIPKEKLLAETDSPFLAPLPFRGQVNRPELVKYVYENIGQIWKTDIGETEKILDSNANKLFDIIK